MANKKNQTHVSENLCFEKGFYGSSHSDVIKQLGEYLNTLKFPDSVRSVNLNVTGIIHGEFKPIQ